MQEKILVLCPSRSRPKQCREMVDSFLATAKQSTLKILLDTDDPCLDEYREILGGRVSYSIDFQKPITKLINENWQFSADCFRWFCVTNDDFVYRTSNWDSTMIMTLKLHGGLGIIYGNDLLQGVNMPTTSIISREIVEALGWLQMPLLTHLFGDSVWQRIGAQAKCLIYRPDVIIEHKHYFSRKVPIDAIYQRTNSKEMYENDLHAFLKWNTLDAASDILKIKNLVEQHKEKYGFPQINPNVR